MSKELKLDKTSWVKTKLGELAEEISVRVENPSKSQYDRFVGLDCFVSGELKIKKWSGTSNVNSSAKAFKAGDVLFARRNAYLKRASLVEFDGCCSGDAFVLRENHDKIVPGFLSFIVNSEKLWTYANSNAEGTMSKRVKWRDLANYEFLLPPKEQQVELAELLWAMDTVIEKDLEVLERLERYIEVSQKSIFQESKTLKLKDLIELNYGKALKDSDRIDGSFKVVSSSGIQGTHNQYLSKGPGIVVGRKGNAGEIFWIEDDFWTIDTAYYVTLKKEYLSYPIKGIYYLLKSVDFKKDLIATAVPGLNRDDALNNRINLPSISELNSYVEKLDKLNELYLKLESKLQSSKALQKALINQVF